MRAGAAAIAVGIYALLIARPVLTSAPGPFQSLRTAFWYDQLGYLSIVSNTADGDLRALEPMTLTGVNHYPRSYYVLVGLFARVFGLEPATAWNLASVGLQASAVIVLSVTIAVLTRRWWLGAFAPAPFLIGTLSVVTSGGWYRSLDSHAVLWGPYGVLFSNNAESSALSLIIIVLCVLALVWTRPTLRPTRVLVSIVAAVVLGALSGFQTYSFLTGTYLLAAVLASIFLSRSRWWWTVASALGLFVVVLAGPLVSAAGGQLATLVFGLLPFVPGMIRGIALTRGWLLLYGGAMAVAAAAPIIWTVSGVLGGDPFLSYRTASNVDLGVVHPETAVASAPIALVFVLIACLAVRARDRLVLAVMAGTSTTVVYLVLNDLWGANAEPYRFWINCLLLGGVIAALCLARLIGSPTPHATSAPPRAWLKTLAIVTAAVYVLSLADVAGFARDDTMNATWNPDSGRERAIAAAADEAAASGEGLVVVDSCISPSTTKVGSPAPIAHYYLGMAWPEAVEEITALMDERDDGVIDARTAAAAGAAWLITDSTCEPGLRVEGAEADPFAEFDYETGSIGLVRLELP